jgi:uncharacterized protein
MPKSHLFQPILKQPQVPHRLVNVTRGVVLATQVEPAFDSNTRRRGLLGRSHLPCGTVLAIAPSSAVHTFRMRFPIDVVFIRRDGRVVKYARNVLPGRITAAWGAFAVLEFGVGCAEVEATQKGDQLAIE